jgi:uncharacterized protein (TIGR02118 family)
MIKLVCLINRPEGVSSAVFREWWLGHHVKVAARLPGLRRYIVSIAEPDEGGEPPYDGVAELWFDSAKAMQAAFDSEDGQECAREDREFIGRRLAFITAEHVVI